MASQLYTLAQGSLLAAEQQHLTEFETWLSDINEPQLDSARLAANVRDECHLVGAGHFGDPNELAAFLKACGQAHSKATSELQRRDGYSSVCSTFELKGLGVEQASLPAGFLRYSASKTLVATLVERMLGKTARRDFDSGLMGQVPQPPERCWLILVKCQNLRNAYFYDVSSRVVSSWPYR